MTTSMTDARYTSLHFTPGHLASLDFDPPPETGWGVMPGFDESLEIPQHLEPPRLDADETLPNMLHPSYPFGRPLGLGKMKFSKGHGGIGNLLLGRGTISHDGRKGEWDELDIGGLVEREKGKEVPPGMAGAKRPPSPPSPQLRPNNNPEPISTHLQNLSRRQQRITPPQTADQFDAPVPNETYAEPAEGEEGGGNEDDGMEDEGNRRE